MSASGAIRSTRATKPATSSRLARSAGLRQLAGVVAYADAVDAPGEALHRPQVAAAQNEVPADAVERGGEGGDGRRRQPVEGLLEVELDERVPSGDAA